MRFNRKKNRVNANRRPVKASRRPIRAAEDGGWVVESWEAWDAYEFACEYMGKESVDEQIIQSLSTDELAACLAFIFRMNDFDEWYDRNGAVDSATKCSGKRPIKAAWGGWNKFYGFDDVEFTVPNDTDDPTIFYNGKYYNYYDIEDTLWSFYKEDCEDDGVVPDEDDFENWVAAHPEYVYDVLDSAVPKQSRGRGVYRKDSNYL